MARTHRIKLTVLAVLPLAVACGDESPPKVQTIQISPVSATFQFLGDTVHLGAIVTDDRGDVMLDVALSWQSSNPSVASAASTGTGAGTATAAGDGSAIITASAEGVRSNEATLTVVQVAASIVTDPVSVAFDALGATQQVTATVVDIGGSAIPGAEVDWVSSSPAVASVNGNGLVTAVSNGTTSLLTSSGTITGSLARVTVAQAVTAISVTPGEATMSRIGAELQLTAEAVDPGGSPVTNATFQWSTNDPAVATVTADGVVIALGNGSVGVNASAAGVSSDAAQVVVAAIPMAPGGLSVALGGAADRVDLTFSDNAVVESEFQVERRTGSADWALLAQLEANVSVFSDTQLTDSVTHDYRVSACNGFGCSEFSNEVSVATGSGGLTDLVGGEPRRNLAGAEGTDRFFRFVVPEGSGEFLVGIGGGFGDADLLVRQGAPATDEVSDCTGFSSNNTEVCEFENPEPGEWFATVRGAASYSNLSISASVRSGDPGYDINLVFVTPVTPQEAAVFTAAVERWQQVITSNVSPRWVTRSNPCGLQGVPLDDVVDDLIIYARVQNVDGQGGILASAGPCVIRSGSQAPHSLAGIMTFDLADFDANSPRLIITVLHEMGHVLGIGTLWNQSPFSFRVDTGTADPIFVGELAVAAFDDVGGTTYSGRKVPVANTGGAGTRDSHWRESVMGDELMTGFISQGGTEKLSTVTIQSLADMGLEVDLSVADAYTLPGSSQRAEGEDVPGDPWEEIYRGPLYAVMDNGDIVLIRPGEGG